MASRRCHPAMMPTGFSRKSAIMPAATAALSSAIRTFDFPYRMPVQRDVLNIAKVMTKERYTCGPISQLRR